MKKIFGYGLFFLFGLGLAIVFQPVLAFPSNPVATTLQGAYDLLIGKLNFISSQIKDLQNTCAKR